MSTDRCQEVLRKEPAEYDMGFCSLLDGCLPTHSQDGPQELYWTAESSFQSTLRANGVKNSPLQPLCIYRSHSMLSIFLGKGFAKISAAACHLPHVLSSFPAASCHQRHVLVYIKECNRTCVLLSLHCAKKNDSLPFSYASFSLLRSCAPTPPLRAIFHSIFPNVTPAQNLLSILTYECARGVCSWCMNTQDIKWGTPPKIEIQKSASGESLTQGSID
ncbi:hypothetical protein HDV63DRAFT_98550 [Trichoderma sp. SZMC 28014]